MTHRSKKITSRSFPVEVIVTVEADTPYVKRKVCPIAALLGVHGRTSSRRAASLHTSSYLHFYSFRFRARLVFLRLIQETLENKHLFFPSIIHTNIEFSRFKLSVIV